MKIRSTRKDLLQLDLIENADNFLLYSITNKYDQSGPDLNDENTKKKFKNWSIKKVNLI